MMIFVVIIELLFLFFEILKKNRTVQVQIISKQGQKNGGLSYYYLWRVTDYQEDHSYFGVNKMKKGAENFFVGDRFKTQGVFLKIAGRFYLIKLRI